MMRLARLAGPLPVLLAPFSGATAQEAGKFPPDRPLKYVVGFAPRGLGDTVARLFSDAVRNALNVNVVVENRTA